MTTALAGSVEGLKDPKGEVPWSTLSTYSPTDAPPMLYSRR